MAPAENWLQAGLPLEREQSPGHSVAGPPVGGWGSERGGVITGKVVDGPVLTQADAHRPS